jgi:erythromycin esterase-like protein
VQALRERRSDATALDALRRAARPLTGSADDHASLLAVVGDARFALIGEASHGTREFYRERAELTRRLIVDKRFTAVVAEADWPDAYRVNRYVRGLSADRDADAALADFKRFPAWMWRNTVVRDFVAWLRQYNDSQPESGKVGFYGMDLYSLVASIEAVLRYLERIDPEAAKRARYRYGCFDHFGEDTQAYGYAAAFGLDKTCEDEVVRELVDISERASDYTRGAGGLQPDDYFFARQNARLVKNAEEYYRTMFRGRVSSWNLRDRHMVETLEALDEHLARAGSPPRIAVWAHNSHLGDARATEMGESGEWNVGQLLRERHPHETALIGFSTHRGTVTAASDWGGAALRKRVRPGLPASCEDLFHRLDVGRFALAFRGDAPLRRSLDAPRLQRAIGVIYLPETERVSHYFHTRVARQFDAMIHVDETHALEPLDRSSGWVDEEAPETYPTGV